MKLSELVNEIRERAKIDQCQQLESLIKWVDERTPKRSIYFKQWYVANKLSKKVKNSKRKVK